MFKFEKFNASNIIDAPAVERVVEFSPSGMDAADVANVLSLAVDGKVISAEAGDGYADVAGRVNFRLVYVDREGAVRGKDYNADFNIKVEGEFTAADSVTAEVSVVETDVATGDMLTLSAVVSVRTGAVQRTETEALVDAEKCYKTAGTVMLPSLVAVKSVSVPVSEEVEVGDVENVLLADAQASVTDATVQNGKVTVQATVFATVTYAEGGEVKSTSMEIPFTEEVLADGAEEGDTAYANASVRFSKIVLSGVQGANVIRFEGEVALRVGVVRCRESEIVSDMFMLTNEIEIQRQSRRFVYCGGIKYVSERISGTASLGDRPAADFVAAVPYARCYVAKAEITDGGALVEGVLNADVVYRDENGLNSVRAEVPYSLEIEGDFGDAVKAVCVVESVSAKARRGSEIDVDATVGILLTCYRTAQAEYISAVEVGAEKEQNTSALSLYIASEGDEMWDVCKALTATPEEVMKQNPALTTPLNAGDRVIYFRSLSVS